MIGISARPVGSFQINLHLFLVKPRALDVSSWAPLRHAVTASDFHFQRKNGRLAKASATEFNLSEAVFAGRKPAIDSR